MIKKTKKFDMRLSNEEFIILQYLSACNNMSMAEYVRKVLAKIALPVKQKIQKGELTYDNLKAYCDSKLQYARLFKE